MNGFAKQAMNKSLTKTVCWLSSLLPLILVTSQTWESWDVVIGYLNSPTGDRGTEWFVWSTDLSLIPSPKHTTALTTIAWATSLPTSQKHRLYLRQTVQIKKKNCEGGSQGYSELGSPEKRKSQETGHVRHVCRSLHLLLVNLNSSSSNLLLQ